MQCESLRKIWWLNSGQAACVVSVAGRGTLIQGRAPGQLYAFNAPKKADENALLVCRPVSPLLMRGGGLLRLPSKPLMQLG